MSVLEDHSRTVSQMMPAVSASAIVPVVIAGTVALFILLLTIRTCCITKEIRRVRRLHGDYSVRLLQNCPTSSSAGGVRGSAILPQGPPYIISTPTTPQDASQDPPAYPSDDPPPYWSVVKIAPQQQMDDGGKIEISVVR
ncbi:uncharacterized protein [Periplaneta americana]|uniref:uncharacterized protein isoform X1 n=1 Tax=Periplaneta americana TaxID=6978 RepID=UPI0037E955F3